MHKRKILSFNDNVNRQDRFVYSEGLMNRRVNIEEKKLHENYITAYTPIT